MDHGVGDRIGRLAALARSRWMWALGGAMLVVNAVVFPAASARMGTGPRTRPLDLRPSYSAEEAHRTLVAMGPTGRHAYLLVETTVDVLYPVVYALFLGALLAHLAHRLTGPARAARGLALLPFGAMLADLLENAGIVLMLRRFPEPLDAIAPAASAFSTIKWLFLAATLGAVVVLGIAHLVARARGSRHGVERRPTS